MLISELKWTPNLGQVFKWDTATYKEPSITLNAANSSNKFGNHPDDGQQKQRQASDENRDDQQLEEGIGL